MYNNLTDLFVKGVWVKTQDLLDNIRLSAKICLLDYLGVTVSGSTIIKDKLQELIGNLESANGTRVIGFSKRIPEVFAAMINGVSAHVIELDDGHRIGMLHLGAPVISALLAVAEKKARSPFDFIRGIVVGYEVAIRLACCVQPDSKLKGYHATGTCGTVGAAMGIAAMLGFDSEQTKSAFSAATTSAAGILEMIEGDTEMKPYNAGRAAMDGVAAAYIGMARFKAPEDALGGKRGFLKVMTDEPKIQYLTDFSGGRYMIESIYRKPYAACRHCHPSIEAALNIRGKKGFDINVVESIHVDTYKLAVEGHDHTEIKGVNSAKMSIPYSLAVALCTGKAGLDEFGESAIANRQVLGIAERVTVSADDGLSALCPQKRVAIVKVKTVDGEFVERVDYPKGEPESPLSKEELEEKFRGLAMYGGLTAEECDAVIDEVWKEDFSVEKILELVCK